MVKVKTQVRVASGVKAIVVQAAEWNPLTLNAPHGNTVLAKKIDNFCSKVIKFIVKSNCNTTSLFSVTDMYTMEMGKLMLKFNQNQLPTIFKNLFRPNNTVHSHSTRNRYAYHLPFYSTSLSQHSIQYSGTKV